MILEGWRDAVLSGRYAGVRYDCASASVARWISRLAKNVRLSGLDFPAAVQTTAERSPPSTPAPSPSRRRRRRGQAVRRTGLDGVRR